MDRDISMLSSAAYFELWVPNLPKTKTTIMIDGKERVFTQGEKGDVIMTMPNGVKIRGFIEGWLQ